MANQNDDRQRDENQPGQKPSQQGQNQDQNQTRTRISNGRLRKSGADSRAAVTIQIRANCEQM